MTGALLRRCGAVALAILPPAPGLADNLIVTITPLASGAMSKSSNPGRTIVMPRASRIRREPPPVVKPKFWQTPEWEERLAIIGIALFGLALTLLILGVGYVTMDDGAGPREIRVSLGHE